MSRAGIGTPPQSPGAVPRVVPSRGTERAAPDGLAACKQQRCARVPYGGGRYHEPERERGPDPDPEPDPDPWPWPEHGPEPEHEPDREPDCEPDPEPDQSVVANGSPLAERGFAMVQ